MTEKTIVLMPEETEEIKIVKESVKDLCVKALDVQINSVESFNASVDIRANLNAAIKKIKTTYKPMIDSNKEVKKLAAEALKTANAFLEKAILPLELADSHVKKKRELFSAEQEEIRIKEERKATEKAQREADKETKRLKDIADRATEKANKLIEEGKTEQAAKLLEKAEEKTEQAENVYVEPVAVEKKVERKTTTAHGTAYNKKTTVIHLPETPEDIKSMCQAIALGNVPTNTVQFSINRLKGWAEANEAKGKIHGMTIEIKITEQFRNN